MLLFVAYSFVIQFAGGLLPPHGSEMAPMVGNACAALVILAVGIGGRYSFELDTLFRLSLPLVLAALLGTLVAGRPAFAMGAHLLSGIGYACFITFATLLLCTISFRYGVSPLWLFGITLAARVPAKPLAEAASAWARGSSADDLTALVVCVAVGFVALCALCGSDGDREGAWGMRPADVDGAARRGPTLDDLDRRCVCLSRACGLTRREEDVLGLLVRGLSVPDVERALTISKSTAKTHVHRIYAKLGVHTRAELLDRFGREHIPADLGAGEGAGSAVPTSSQASGV